MKNEFGKSGSTSQDLRQRNIKIKHDGHIDFLNCGELIHYEHGNTAHHRISVNAKNPDECTIDHPATGHNADHVHGPDCGHPAIPHGNHTDYIVDGKLHHFHGDHCDDHGEITLA